MTTAHACPQCTVKNTCPDGDNHVCADCSHEWLMAAAPETEDADAVVKDSNGNAVVLIKDLNGKGS